MSMFSHFSRRKFIFSCIASLVLKPEAALASTQMSELQADSFEPFSFAVVNGCHLASGLSDNFMLLQESQLFLQDTIKQLNALKPDFVVFIGDQVQGVGENDSNWQLFLDILQTLDCAWHFVLGESDISGLNSMNKMHTFGRDWKGRGLNNEAPYWSCDQVKGVHLIGLDTTQGNSNCGYIDQRQLDWLNSDITEFKPITILFSHHSLLPISEKWTGNLLPQASAVNSILDKASGSVIAISGYDNCNKISWQGKTWYVACPALDIYPCAFRFFSVKEKYMQVETYQVNFPALVKKAKDQLLNSNIARSAGFEKHGDFLRLIMGNHCDLAVKLSLEEAGKFEAISKVISIK